MNIEFRQLRYFAAVAEELHFGRAARRLHITQPPLTRQIQQLEMELGVQLFERTKRRVALTDAGQTFWNESAVILAQLNRAADMAQRTARGEIGELRMGFISTANYSVLPKILKAFKRRRPDVRVRLHELTGDEQQDALERGSLDVGIMFPEHNPALEWLTLFREPFVAAVATDHPLGAGKSTRRLAAERLRDEPFVMVPRALAPSLYDRIIAYTEANGFNPRIAQEARQMQTIIGLVAGNIGVSIIPASMRALKRDDVRFHSLTPKTPTVDTCLVWNPARNSIARETFQETCLAAVGGAFD
jgi:DNA-binding transcriptional LysR family regulator